MSPWLSDLESVSNNLMNVEFQILKSRKRKEEFQRYITVILTRLFSFSFLVNSLSFKKCFVLS